MNERSHRLEGLATLEQARLCAEETGRVLRDWGFPEERVQAWEIAVAEMGTNVVRHGYPPDDLGPLVLDLRQDEDGLEIAVSDCGRGFDPGGVNDPPDPDPDDPATWPEGGMGLMLVRSAGDDLRYETVAGRHILTLYTALPVA